MTADEPAKPTDLVTGIVLFPGVEELDFVGPWEVFSVARKKGFGIAPLLVAERNDPIRCGKGMRVLPDCTFADCPSLDIVLVPGGNGTRTEVNNKAMIDFLVSTAKTCRWIASVCTGAGLVGKAGLADGKRLTSYWNGMDFVAASAPAALLVRDERVVIDGNLISGAGVSAGIDLALTLVGEIFGRDAVLSVQEYMEYYPEPPFGGTHPVKKARA